MKNKMVMMVFCVCIGIVLGVGSIFLLNKKDRPEVLVEKQQEQINASEENEKAEENKKVEELAQNQQEDQEKTEENKKDEDWQEQLEYIAGERVRHNGVIFEAKWWTQGEMPDQNNEWGVWRVVGEEKENIQSVQETWKVEKPLNKEGFKVVGYFPAWKPEALNTVQYDQLTHINYAFAIPTEDSQLRPLPNEEMAKRLIERAHKKDVKVLLAIGGWEYEGVVLEPIFASATQTDEKCRKLANSIIEMVNTYGFDGVDIDWEHPRVDGGTGKQYQALMRYLREGLDKENKLLTTAVVSGVSADGMILYDAAAHTEEVLRCVDWINVMAYDGGEGERHSSFEFAMSSGNYWLSVREMPKDKIVLGIPFYGRPTWKSYQEILTMDAQAQTKDQVDQIFYNGIATVKNKTDWALAHLGGVMIWELTQDSTKQETSLLNAIYEQVNNGVH